MTKHPRPIDDQRDAVIKWGFNPDTGNHFVLFNVAAWKVVNFIGQSAAVEPGAAVIDVISGLMSAGMASGSPPAAIPKLKFEWMLHRSGEAILIFHGQTFQSFCRCVELPEEPAKLLLLKGIEQHLFSFRELHPNELH